MPLPASEKRKSASHGLANGEPVSKKARGAPFSRVAGDFVAIPFRVADALQYVYAREQAPSEDEDWPAGRALFLSSLPTGSSREDVLSALSGLTDEAAESVQFVGVGRDMDEQRRSLLDTEGVHEPDEIGSIIPPLFVSDQRDRMMSALRPPHSAIVVFTSPSAVSRILKARPIEPPTWPAPSLPSFEELHQLMRPSLATVKAHTDAWMRAFEKREAIAASLPAPDPAAAGADDDGGGWTLVKRGGTHGRSLLPTQAAVADKGMATGLSSVHVASRAFEVGAKHGLVDEDAIKKIEKKRKKQEYIREGLYHFEKDARRQKSLALIRNKFERDKELVEERRRQRAFKPY